MAICVNLNDPEEIIVTEIKLHFNFINNYFLQRTKLVEIS